MKQFYKNFFVLSILMAAVLLFSCSPSTGERGSGSSGGSGIKYTITFNSNNGANEIKTQQVSRGTATKLEANTFSYDGYSFINWCTKEDKDDADAKIYSDEDSVSLLADLDLYAMWELNDCIIYFNAGNYSATGTMETVGFVSKSSFTLPQCDFRVTDKGFKGWTLKLTDPDDSYYVPVINFTDGQKIPAGYFTEILEAAVAEGETLPVVITLYAVWADPDYYINYNFVKPSDATILDSSKVMTKQGGFIDVDQKLYSNTYAISGYGFKGWSKVTNPAVDAEIDYKDSDSILLNASQVSALSSKTLNLYTVWSKKVTTIIFNANAGDDSVEGSMENQTLCYNVGTKLITNTYVRANYQFAGWNTKPDGTGTSFADGASFEIPSYVENITLYAQWKHIWTISFKANVDGASGSMANVKVVEGDSFTIPELKFTAARKQFNSWSTKADGTGTKYAAKATFVPTGNITLYAQWDNVWTITFMANGGSSKDVVITVAEGAGKSYTFRSSEFNFTYQYHQIKEWNTKADGSGTSYAYSKFTITNPTSDLVLYAIWENAVYTITYNINTPSLESSSDVYGSGPTTQNIEYGVQGYTKSCGWTLTDYTFTGWNTKANGTGVSYSSAESIKLTNNINLYAQWTPKEYTLTLYDTREQDSVPAAKFIKYKYGDNVSISSFYEFSLSTSIKSSLIYYNTTTYNWIFDGWSRTQGSTSVNYTKTGTSPVVINSCTLRNASLYAVHHIDRSKNNTPVIFVSNIPDAEGVNSNKYVPNTAITKIKELILFEDHSDEKCWYYPGKKLVGFSSSPDGYVEYVCGQSFTMPSGNLYAPFKLYGVWVNGQFSTSMGTGSKTVKRNRRNYNNGTNYVETTDTINVTKAFCMEQYEVTVADYYKVTGKKPFTAGTENNPVVMISITDAIDYCNRRSELEDKTPVYTFTTSAHSPSRMTINSDNDGYRIPTYFEWLWASYQSYTDYGTNSGGVDDAAWYIGNSGNSLHDVGLKGKNIYGVYDLCGNAAEMTVFGYSQLHEQAGGFFYIMGGAYLNSAENVKRGSFDYRVVGNGLSDVGFRTCYTIQ